MNNIENKIVIYEDGELNISTKIEDETLWITQKQMQDIFGRERSVITKHIDNIFKDEEVDIKSNVQKMHIPNSDKPVSFYSLDIVLAVGYRASSSKAIKFRQWATQILKQYILNGYAINKKHLQKGYHH